MTKNRSRRRSNPLAPCIPVRTAMAHAMLMVGVALASPVCAQTISAPVQGGHGANGANGTGGAGGAAGMGVGGGGTGGNGGNGGSGAAFADGTPGSDGHGGGLGGHLGSTLGGASGGGGAGAFADISGALGGGGGVGGASGIVLDGVQNITNESVIEGGNGGHGASFNTVIGSGGGGGNGVTLSNAGGTVLTNGSGGLIAGGHGGGGSTLQGAGGDGGSGVWLEGSGALLINEGTIRGGGGGYRSRSGGTGVVGRNLTIVNTGTIEGGNNGDGVRAASVRFLGGVNRLEMHNEDLLGPVVIDAGASATLAAGVAGLDIGNALQVVGDADFDTGGHGLTWSGAISGAGSLSKSGAGTLTLSGSNSYLGVTHIDAGVLRAGATNSLSAASAHVVAVGAMLDLAGWSQRVEGITNAGTVSLLGSAPGAVLTVTGPWVGQGGTLVLGAALGDSGSATDQLLLSGVNAVASGSTLISIVNQGGLGGHTTGNGIAIVRTENDGSILNDAFTLAAPVSAGPYDYTLHASSTGVYLSNAAQPPSPPAPSPPAPSPAAPPPSRPPASVPAAPPPPVAAVPTYRLEVPMLSGLPEQWRHVGWTMVGDRQVRLGDTASGADTSHVASEGRRRAWGRFMAQSSRVAQMGVAAPVSDGRLSGFQTGTDVWSGGGWSAGVFVGQAEARSDVSGFARGQQGLAAGVNRLRGQFVGGYVGWQPMGSPWYVDMLAQQGRLRYTLLPHGGSASAGDGRLSSASVEVGRAFALTGQWRIEPQVQLLHQRVTLDDVALPGATTVAQAADRGWMARVGVRLQGQLSSAAGPVQPYMRLNLYQGARGVDTATYRTAAASTDITVRTGGRSSALAVGAAWWPSPAAQVYGQIGRQWAEGGPARVTSGWSGSVGLALWW